MKKKQFVLLLFIVCFACQGQMDDIELEDGDPDITACGKIEISENEYLIMQIVPALVSSESLNPQAKNFPDSEKKLRCIGGKILLDIAKTA